MQTKRIVIGAGAVFGSITAWGLLAAYHPQPQPIQGQIEAREVHVAAKIPGRIGHIDVELGQAVKAGDPLFELTSLEADAKLAQARAAEDAARSIDAKAQHGTRPEEIEMARLNLERAQASAQLAEATYRRIQSLFDEGLLARQKRDEAETQWRAAEAQAGAARAQYQMAQHGARSEDRIAADAQARQVAGVVAEASAAQAETHIKAPAAGEVARLDIQSGELAPQGFPVLTLVDLSDAWAVLQVREDDIARFAKDTEHSLRIPALNRSETFRVSAVAVLPEFATWKAAHPGGVDLRTFEIRLRPVQAIDGLRPGMSVVTQ
jgi:HlyD family secretion protein